ncbi:BT_3987 domain-containing protein [Terrimonas rubra]|uniref:BT_3987 domain-containing protein n=1 Tax=Terrimonas rubra TaxID=1035890 RepID=A0ABW6A7R8_9BACT
MIIIKLRHFYRLYIMASITILFVCCNKNDELNTKEVLVYAPAGTAAYNISAGNIAVLRNESVAGSGLSFPVLLTRSFEKEVQVTAVIDTSLLAVYDSINKVTSPRFKISAFKLADQTVTIRQGQTSSSDSVRLVLADTVGLDLTKTYIVPVRLTASSQNIPVSNTRQVMYLRTGIVKITSRVSTGLLSQQVGFTAGFKASPVIGFPVLINAAIAKNVTITAIDDASLVAAYNSANGTSYSVLPAGSYTFVKNSATINAGTTTSADSIKVQVPDLSILTAGTGYLLPVKIKDEGEIAPATTNNVKYILITPRLALAAIPASGSNVINIAFIKPPTGNITGPAQTGFGAALNYVLNTAVQVGVNYDASLVDSYNAANGTSYIAFPAGSFTVSKDNVTIAAGATTSATDSFRVQFSNYNSFSVGSTYLLPLTIKSGGNVDAGTNKHVYIRVTVSVQNIDPSNTGLTGTTISRAGWSVTTSGSYPGNDVSRVLDGNNSTAWDSDGNLPAWVQLDMGTAKTVKGFPIVPSYEYGRVDNFLQMEVLSSNDGITWTSQGTYNGTTTSSGSSPANPDIKTVKFFQPVTARYFKFSITKTTDGRYAGMGELNAVE